jgi:hypothetical protein
MNELACSQCGARFPASGAGDDGEAACRAAFSELLAYSLSTRDPNFVHQLVVDAYTAQHAGPGAKPLAVAFALVGLYLVCERGYTGRYVQRAHTALAQSPRAWPEFEPPAVRSALTVAGVLAVPDGEKPDRIRAWAHAAWEPWRAARDRIEALLAECLGE